MSETKSVTLSRDEHINLIEEALAQAGEEMDRKNPPETERAAFIAKKFLENVGENELERLNGDMRIEEARQVVARDHNMNPENVSLENLLKITAGAYCGYQQTSDWRPTEEA